MLRELQTIGNKNIDAVCVAGADLMRGMGVIKIDGKAALPTQATCDNIFFVTKEPNVGGLNALRGELPEYSEIYETIAEGEKVLLVKPIVGERYFTDQVAAGLTNGSYLAVSTDGKFTKAAAGTQSRFVVADATYMDAGHKGIKLEVVDPVAD